VSQQSESRHRGIFEKVPGSGVWWVRWHDSQGRRHREKIGPKSLAVKLYQKRRTEVLQQKKLPELHRPGFTFGEIAADALAYAEKYHRDFRSDRCRMVRPLAWWKHRPADSLTPKEIEQRLASVTTWGDSTRNRIRTLLMTTYKLALRRGKAKENPARLIPAHPERNVRSGFITDAEYSKLVQQQPALWLRAMLALGYTYGWRAGELVNLRLRQVDLAARTLRLEPGTTKNMQARTIRLTSECFELVKACAVGKQPMLQEEAKARIYQGRPRQANYPKVKSPEVIPVNGIKQNDFLFTREDGGRVRAYRYSWEQLCVRASLGSFICSTCKVSGPPTTAAGRPCSECRKAGRRGVFRYDGLLFHDLRRSAVRNLERSGVPRSVAMQITGHRTEAVYRRYAIVSESDMSEAVVRLERLRLQPQNQGAPEGAPDFQGEPGIRAKMM
jgi:integrase